MPRYRIYQLNESGHIVDRPKIIEATTDTDAIAQATQIVDARDLEIWDASRCVGKIEHRPDKKPIA